MQNNSAWATLHLPRIALKTHFNAIMAVILKANTPVPSYDDFVSGNFTNKSVIDVDDFDDCLVSIEIGALPEADSLDKWQANLIADKVPFSLDYGSSSDHAAGCLCVVYDDMAQDGYGVFRTIQFYPNEIAAMVKSNNLETTEQLLEHLAIKHYFPEEVDWDVQAVKWQAQTRMPSN